MSSNNNNHNKEEEESFTTNAAAATAAATNSSEHHQQYSYPSPPVQYQQQYNFPTSNNHNNHFYPPHHHHHHQAARSTSSVHQQQHGLYQHNDASSSLSHYDRSPAEEGGGDSLPSLRNADSNATSWLTSFRNNHNHTNTLGLYTTPTAIRDYYGRNSELYNQEILPAANTLANCTRKSPYFSPPPPLPPVPAARDPSKAATLTVSPNDRHESSSKTIYQQSPYSSEAPALGAGSGSSESSTASTTTSTFTSATTTNNTRPVPARSAFMCFSQAKGEAIKARKGKGSKGGFVEAVASEWRSISKQEKAYWERIAKNEKTRFAKEKEALCKAHNGPVPRKLRAKKNPLVRHNNLLYCMFTDLNASLLSAYNSFLCIYNKGTQTSNERLPHVCPAEATSVTEGESRYVQR